MNNKSTMVATTIGLSALAFGVFLLFKAGSVGKVEQTNGSNKEVPTIELEKTTTVPNFELGGAERATIPNIQMNNGSPSSVRQGLSRANIPNITANSVSELKTKTLMNLKADSNRLVLVVGEVNYSSMEEAKNKLQQIDKTKGPIYVLISSPGGSVFAGESFITAMQSAENPVYTVCLDICASMGAIIHQYGTQRYAYDRATLMFHDASGAARGKVGEMMSLLSFIDRKLEKTNRYIAIRSGMSYDKWTQMSVRDLWIDSEDAYKEGLVDKIVRVIPLGNLSLDELLMNKGNRFGSEGAVRVLPMTFGLSDDSVSK